MQCGNSKALENYQNKLKKQEVSFELLLSSIDDDLVEIQELIMKVKKRALDYDGLDFTDEIKDILREIIWIN